MSGQACQNAQDILPRCREIEHSLSAFSVSAEKAFVPVGERLAGLQSRSREIARTTTRIAELLSRDDGSLTVLGEVLNTAGGDNQHGDIPAIMAQIREKAVAVHHAIGTVMELVKTFGILGMMTRIESSRFEGNGTVFGGLAEDVSALSRQIRGKIGVATGSAIVLLETSHQATEELRRVAKTREESLGPLARQTSVGLSKIREHRNRVAHANTLLASRFEGVSSAIGDIVTAMQFHDIVRQQIEHVLTALRLLHHPDNSGNPDETLRLQTAQLQNSHATFQGSVEQIRSALKQMESNISEVAEESRRLLESPEGGGRSFFAGMESDVTSILGLLDRNAHAERHLAEAAISVHQSVSEMSDTIAGVRTIGNEMHLIALNARIQARYLGSAGASLEVVAHEIQGLSRDSEAASDRIEDLLSNVRTAVTLLQQAKEGSNRNDELMGLLRKSAAALKCVQDEAHDGHLGAVGLIEGMKQQIGETIAMFNDVDRCLETLAQANEMLRGFQSDAPRTGSHTIGSSTAIYTMQSERAVHESLYATAPRNLELPPAIAPAVTGDDNVEFF